MSDLDVRFGSEQTTQQIELNKFKVLFKVKWVYFLLSKLEDRYDTVEPVYNGPVLSGHPLLSSQFSKSRFLAHRYGECPHPNLSLSRQTRDVEKGEKMPITSNFKNFSYSFFKSNTFNVRVLFAHIYGYIRS